MSESHLLVAYDAKSILIDMFALIFITDIDVNACAGWKKLFVNPKKDAHDIMASDEWGSEDFTLFH